MNPKGPEYTPSQGKSENGIPFGYTVARIKNFTPEPRTPINTSDYKNGLDKDAAKNEEMSVMQIKVETNALASMFIPKLWGKIQNWMIEHPPGLALNGTGDLIPVSREEFIRLTKGSDSVQVINLIREFTESVFLKLSKEWENEQKQKLLEPEPDSAEEKRILKAYGRYQKVIGFGINNTSNEEGEPAESTGEHILGGLATGRTIIFNSFRILLEVYRAEYGKVPTKEEMVKLVESAKPLVLTMAQSDLQTFGSIEDNISRKEGSIGRPGFLPEKFAFAKQGNNFSLEIKPEVLDEVEKELKITGHSVLHTGCPALFAKGPNGKNVVTELYDLFAKLYKEFYIDTHSEFR